MSNSLWLQRTVTIAAKKRGCHSITKEIEKEIGQDLARIDLGIAHFFLQHTSASLCVNESWDRDVQLDMEDSLNRLAPEKKGLYRHSMEGPDDMPAHIKSALVGVSLSIPVTRGRLNMGQWQGLWLMEHRDHASKRRIVVTINGSARDGSQGDQGDAASSAAQVDSSDEE